MKANHFIYTTVAGCCLLAATLTGCSFDFLDTTPESDYVADKYYNSDAAVVKAIEPLYNRAWHEFNRRSLMAMGSIRANDAWNPYVNSEFARFQLTGLDENVAAVDVARHVGGVGSVDNVIELLATARVILDHIQLSGA